jgi:hypothetical protein
MGPLSLQPEILSMPVTYGIEGKLLSNRKYFLKRFDKGSPCGERLKGIIINTG